MRSKHILSALLTGWILTASSLLAQTQLTNLPTIYINTVNSAAVQKSVWTQGFLTVVGGDSSDVKVKDTIQIRGRGNSTWDLAKKPYRIKFERKRHLLGLEDDAKDWVLLANHCDKTLIRNAVAFEIGRFMGMEFTPSTRFADVYLNNVFIGNYHVTDQIEAGKNRVNIDKLEGTDIDEPNISGGYLVERDGFNNREAVYFQTNKAVPFSVKEPDSELIQAAQINYIKDFLNQYEARLFSANWTDTIQGYRAHLDTTSFLNWYIASELTGNIDCFWSTYMYKRRADPKLYYGPLWDYDIAFNNDSRRNDISKVRMLSTAFENKTWITQVANDPWFKKAVNNRWKQLVKQGIQKHLQSYIDSMALYLDASQKKNYEKWGTLSTKIYNNWYTYSTYQEYINVLKAYVDTRVSFLTSSFASDAPAEPTPPFKTESFYYSITNKASMTLMDVQNQSTAEDTRVVHYAAVENRQSQQWKIVKLQNGSFQIVNRYTGKAMQTNGLNRTVRLYSPNQALAVQQWRIEPLTMGGGAYRIVNVSSGNATENTNGSTANGTLVNENPIATVEKANQAWFIEKVSAIEVPVGQLSVARAMELGENPVSDRLKVRLNGVSPAGSLSVYDVQGILLKTVSIDASEMVVDVSELPQCLYVLRWIGNDCCNSVRFLVRR